jgi:PEGA domain
MMRSVVTAILFAIAALCSTGSAFAQQKSSVQILAISSEDAFEQAQAFTIALKRAVTRTEGWTLSKGDFSLEVMTAAMGCSLPPDAGCQKKIADKIGTKRYIWGTLTKSGKKEVVAILRLWESGEQKRDTEVHYASNLTDPSDDTLLAVAADAFARLTGEATGIVVVNAGNVNGTVYVDGKEVGDLTDGRTELTLPSGDHKVVVRATGYNDAIGTITVRAGASTDITLNPTPTSSGSDGSNPIHDKGKPGNTKKVLGYAAVGVGGALVAVGGYFWVRSFLEQSSPSDTFTAYRSAQKPAGGGREVPSGVDVCEAANANQDNQTVIDECDRNASHKRIALILTPVGAALAGVGAYLLLTSDDEKAAAEREGRAPRPAVQPMVALGPKGGAVWVAVPF